MRFNKKEKLCLESIMADPVITYPACYQLSRAQIGNEMLHDAIRALHMVDFQHYERPDSFEALFSALRSGRFAIYKEGYVVGYFGEKLMYLQPQGWKSLPAGYDIFMLENWLI